MAGAKMFDSMRNDMKKGSRMTRIAALALIGAGMASASVVADNQQAIQNKMDSLDSKRGLEINGSIRSGFFRSTFDSEMDQMAVNNTSDREQNEFVVFDLKLGFRPWDDVRANAIIRMSAGMQEYFAAAAKNVSVPWLNIEGKVGDFFHYVVGDFRQAYSPLTLYSPDVEFLYEPDIYHRNRQIARSQVLLEGNQRNLQGVNLQFRDSFGDAIGEVRAEGIFSRLRRPEYLDMSGAMGNLLPNEGVSGAHQTSGMDKYLAALNLENYPLKKNVMVGLTQMLIWDDENSLQREYRKNYLYIKNRGNDPTHKFKYGPVNPYDTLPQNTMVTSLRLGADGAGLLNNQNLILDFTAEYAMSKDDVYEEFSADVPDSVTGQPFTLLKDSTAAPKTYDTLKVLTHEKSSLNGKALLVELNIGYQVESTWMVKATANYLMNDSNWFNNLAQSPSFFPRRIMNSEKDGNTSKYGINSPLYSTFDALYHFTPKFSPVPTTLGTDDNAMRDGQTESYNIAPYAKNSWNTAVLTRKELEIATALSDPTVQLALPNGLATSNRKGIKSRIVAGYGKNNAVEVQGLFTALTEVNETWEKEPAEFNEIGAGAKVNVFQFIGIDAPLELSGSYKASNRKQAKTELSTNFINAGLYYRFFRRFGFAAGFQKADMELNTDLQQIYGNYGVEIPVAKGEQQQWMVGLDYTMSKYAWLAINYGRVNVKNTYAKTVLTDANADNTLDTPVKNWPNFVNGNKVDTDVISGASAFVHEFSLDLVEATINVDF